MEIWKYENIKLVSQNNLVANIVRLIDIYNQYINWGDLFQMNLFLFLFIYISFPLYIDKVKR